MNLRNKTLIALGIICIFATVLILALSLTFYTGAFLNLEQQQAEKDLSRAMHAIDNELNGMEGIVGDWGWWDDTYRFSQDLNPEYITNNLGESTFKDLRLNYFVITGTNGTVLYTKGYDLAAGREVPVPKYFVTEQTIGNPPAGFPAQDRKLSGIISSPEGQILVASAPILTSVEKGPSPGYLVLGRKIDDHEISLLSDISGESLFITSTAPAGSSTGAAFVPWPLRTLSTTVNQTDPSLLITESVIIDAENKPAFILGARTPRGAYQNALGLIRDYYITFIIIMVLFTGLVILITDRLVLTRLSTLISRVQKGAGLAEGEHLPPMPGNDEFNKLDDVITEAQKRISESEARFRRIVETAQEGIWVLDANSNTSYVNDRMAAMLGYSPGEMLNLPGSTLIKPEEPSDTKNRNGNYAHADGVSLPYEMAIPRKDGSVLHALISITPVFENRMFAGSFAMVTDITDRKRAEEALQLATRKLNILSKGALTDLTNQIFTLLGYCELSGALAADGNLREYLVKERAAAEKIQNQIEYIRHFQDLGIHPPKWQDVNSVFLFAISHLDLSHVKRTLDLGSIEIYADPLLEKVLFTLVENTLVHGKNATEIRCYSVNHGETALIYYEDNGVGIPAADKESIFRHHYAGKGLPLFLVREILSITEISIREIGEPGKGARFELRIKKEFFRYSHP